MSQLQTFVRCAFSAVSVALTAAPSTTRAETIPSVAQIEPLTQATISKTINGIVVELRENYVFADKGAQAADALEKSLKENTYVGMTDPHRFAQQISDQLRAMLVGPKTYSAGEEFAYDLQVLKRATIVGEKTRGGANPGGLTDLGSNFFAVIPTGRAENPITRTNWEGVGVLPDVKAVPEAAESIAIAMVRR